MIGSGEVAPAWMVDPGAAGAGVGPLVVDVHAASITRARIVRHFERDLIRHIDQFSQIYFERELPRMHRPCGGNF